MNRLTKYFEKDGEYLFKLNNDSFGKLYYKGSDKDSKQEQSVKNINAMAQKLGQYEDIEEDFRIDLIKILTAKEVYTFGTDVIAPYKLGETNKIIKCSIFYFDFINKIIHIHVPKVGFYCEPFSNYGKTWSFVKEDLKLL